MKIRRPFALSFAQFAVALLLEFVGLVVLARLLTPSDLGKFAAALAIALPCRTITEFGLYEYVVNTAEEKTRELASIVGFAQAIAAAGAIVLLLVALLPRLLDPVVAQVLMILAVTVLIHPWLVLPTGRLHRNLRMEHVLVAKLLSSLAFLLTSVWLAHAGWGALSMAWAMLASTSVYAVITNAYTSWVFVKWPRCRGWRELSRSGSLVTATAGTAQLSDSAVTLIAGALAGFGPLGLFVRARDLLKYADRVVAEAVVPVLFPFIAHEMREGRDLANAYLMKISHAAAVCWPLALMLMLFAEPLVALLLGERWLGSAQFLAILGSGLLVLPFNMSLMSFAVSMRLIGPYLALQLAVMTLQVASVAATAGRALALTCALLVLCEVLRAALNHILFARHLDLRTSRLRDALRAPSIAIVLGLPAMVALHLATRAADLPDFLILACAGGALSLVWIACLWWFDHAIKHEILRLLRRDANLATLG